MSHPKDTQSPHRLVGLARPRAHQPIVGQNDENGVPL